jgi:hypothetical protein
VTRNSSNKAGRQNIGRKRLNLKALALMAALIPLASFVATAEFAPSDPVSVATQSGVGARNDVFGRALISAMKRETQQRPPPHAQQGRRRQAQFDIKSNPGRNS